MRIGGPFLRWMLAVAAVSVASSAARADEWPQWGGPQRDLIWREEGVAQQFPTDGLLPRVWSTPLGEGYSGPAVADGRVFITDYLRKERTERVLALDAQTGEVLWKHAYPVTYTISYANGPRATPTVDADRVYTVGAMGDLFCFEASTGEVLWQRDFVEEYGTTLPTWGIAGAPLVDGEQLICLVGGEDGALVVSFDKYTGRELWRSLEDPEVGYSPPVIFEFGGVRQLIVWHPAAVSSLDPSNGEVIWEVPFQVRSGLSIATPRKAGKRLFVTCFYNGPLMLEVAADGRSAEILWQGASDSEVETDGLHSIIPTPYMNEEAIYGVCSYGQLRGLDADTGERLWMTFEATGEGRWWNAFLIRYAPIPDRFFIHNEQGELILAELTRDGYEELDRAKLVEPTRRVRRRMTIWSHPAFAHRSVFARNDEEIVRVDLSAD